MKPIKMLINLGLLSWSTIYLGLKNGWASRQDAIDFAVNLLLNDNNEEDVAVIAAGDSLNDNELFKLISDQIRNEDVDDSMEKWRLAHLLCIAESGNSEQEKIDELQNVYSKFNYPEDMTSCSIYAQDNIDPLVAMMQVVKELQRKFSVE